MGTDYIPFDIVSSGGLLELIQVHSTTFRSMPYFWSHEDVDESINLLLVGLHKPTCLDAAKRIKEKIKLYPQQSWRVYPITSNYALPLSVRFEALGSIMPTKLPSMAKKWRKWVSDLRKEEHLPYLKELFLWQSAKNLKHKINELQETVRAYNEKYPSKLDKQLVFQILMLNTNFTKFVVQEIDTDWFRTNHAATVGVRFDSYVKYYNLVRYCIYQYKRNTSNKWKSAVDGMPKEPFTNFKSMLDSMWNMDEFLAWVDIQVEHGRGLFLSF